MEGRKGKAIAFRKGRSSRERVTGERKNDRERDIIYHPAVCRRNSLQMLFNLPDGKPSCFPSLSRDRVPLHVGIPTLLTSFPLLLFSLFPPLLSPSCPFASPYRGPCSSLFLFVICLFHLIVSHRFSRRSIFSL